MCLAMMLVKVVQQDARYWYPSALGPPFPTMTDSLLALGRGVFHNVARAPNGLSNEHLVFRPYYLGSLSFAGHWGGGGTQSHQ